MQKLLHNDLRSITLSKLLVGFGGSLVSVFIPLLLLQRGFALWQICLFYAMYAVCKLVVNYPSALIINARGARAGLIVGYASTAAFLLLLNASSLPGWQWLVFVSPLAMALTNSFSWNSEHLHISRVMDEARKSRDIANIASLTRVVSLAAPLVGGLIAAFGGPNWLLAMATLFVLAAIVPVWQADKLAGGHVRQQSLSYSFAHAPRGDVLANFAYNTHGLIAIFVWPIFLAVALPNFTSIGFVTTLSSIVAILVLQVAGIRGDSGKLRRVLFEGTVAVSLTHLLRLFAINPALVTAITSIDKSTMGYQQNAWTSLYYAHARRGGINYILSMEIAGDLAYIFVWTLLGAVAFVTQNASFLNVAFIIAALAAWGSLLITKELSDPTN